MTRIRTALATATASMALLVGAAASAQEINVYSSRHYDTDIALYDNFTEQTGIAINLIEGSADALIERIQAEGVNSPADMLITVDAGRLWLADSLGLLQPVDSEILQERVPESLRHPDGHWFGLSSRARVIMYNVANGTPEGLEDYEDLADPVFRDMLCIRSSSNIYNLSLMSALIDSVGEEAAEAWAAGVLANFARDPEGNDTAQIRAVAAGECDIAVANTYYVGRLLASDNPDDVAVGEAIGIIFPNQGNRGTHVNISGAGVVATAPNPEGAIAFLEYLVSDEAQRLFAEGNNEYPVVDTIPVPGPIAGFGEFEAEAVNANVYGENQSLAVQVYDRVGWR